MVSVWIWVRVSESTSGSASSRCWSPNLIPVCSYSGKMWSGSPFVGVRFAGLGSANSLVLASTILPVWTEARLSGRTPSAGTTVAARTTRLAHSSSAVATTTRLHSGAVATGAVATRSAVATSRTLRAVAAVVGAATVAVAVTVEAVHAAH